MNTPPPVRPAVPASAISAQQHLEQNRERIAAWLEQDQHDAARRSPMDRALRIALPLLTGPHNAGGLALLAALLPAWLRSGGTSTQPGASAGPLALGLTLVRRHPKATLLAVGVVGLVACAWGRSPSPGNTRPNAAPAPDPLP